MKYHLQVHTMKALILTAFFLGFHLFLNAQSSPKIGDELVINSPKGIHYNHISFPRLNFLVKKGKPANYKSVYGNKVVVRQVIYKGSKTYVLIEKKNREKFFGYITQVKANYNESIKSGELLEL